jgi:DNA processing protein
MAGLALGVDAAAHRAALDAGGRTVAVIGTGISRAYPAEHRTLQEEIAARGLLLSQFWPDAPPQKHTFLMRNATMSVYGLATVVIEAGEQSGARAQARMSVEHGRPVILAAGVVEQNEWAQALASRPGVQVAGSPASVLRAVDQLMTEREATENELRPRTSVTAGGAAAPRCGTAAAAH